LSALLFLKFGHTLKKEGNMAVKKKAASKKAKSKAKPKKKKKK
jgi:hypothetical protein